MRDSSLIVAGIHGIDISLQAGDRVIRDEFRSDFRGYLVRRKPRGAPTLQLQDCRTTFPIAVPDRAIRSLVSPRGLCVYTSGDSRYLYGPERFIIRVDLRRLRAEGFYRQEHRPLDILHYLTKWMALKHFERSNIYSMHGSCVAKDGKALCFVGPSNYGKTSSLLMALEHGYSLVADDNILIRSDWILPFHMRSTIRDATVERYPMLRELVGRKGSRLSEEGTRYVDLGQAFPVEETPVASEGVTLFQLNVWNSTETEVHPVVKSRVVSLLCQMYFEELAGSYWFDRDRERIARSIFESFYAFVQKVRCYQLTAGSDVNQVYRAVSSVT